MEEPANSIVELPADCAIGKFRRRDLDVIGAGGIFERSFEPLRLADAILPVAFVRPIYTQDRGANLAPARAIDRERRDRREVSSVVYIVANLIEFVGDRQLSPRLAVGITSRGDHFRTRQRCMVGCSYGLHRRLFQGRTPGYPK